MSEVAEFRPPMAESVRKLEAVLRQMPDQLDAEELTAHHFCSGIYARELFVPAGATLVGKTHSQENLFFLLMGEMTFTTDAGPVTVRAPYMAVTKPGTKRAGFAHTDCLCMNVHHNPDDERDLVLLEDRYITPEALPAPEPKELLECHG